MKDEPLIIKRMRKRIEREREHTSAC